MSDRPPNTLPIKIDLQVQSKVLDVVVSIRAQALPTFGLEVWLFTGPCQARTTKQSNQKNGGKYSVVRQHGRSSRWESGLYQDRRHSLLESCEAFPGSDGE